MLGKLLCWLGVHDNVVTGRNVFDNRWQSVWGGCTRCNKPFQWDN